MKILVTGGAGFIGTNLVEELVRLKHTVIVIDNLEVTDSNVATLKRLKVAFYKKDIAKYDEIKRLFSKIDIVFHLAAMNRAQRSIEDPLRANASNITGTLNCLEAARQAKVKRFVFISSSSVYAGQRNKNLTEDMPLAPPHPYGVGKLAGEHYARIYHEIYGLETVILRYFSVYGPRQLGMIDKAGVVAKFIHCAVQGKPMEIFGDGEQKRNFTYVKDVVHYSILASQAPSAVGKVINIAAEEEISVNELVALIGKISKKTLKKVYLTRPGGDPDRNPADISMAKKILGYKPQYSFVQGITETVAWYKTTQKTTKQ
jgi:nucleoside-diphosphate-sugar epimerase